MDTPDETPAPFEPYECSLGTVTGIEGDSYHITTAEGRVIGIQSSTTPSAENVEADIANPPVTPPPARRQETRVILDRLTTDEQAALLLSDVPAVRLLIAKATATGVVRDDDPDFPAAVAGLGALGIIAADRWDDLLA